jgi:hypothetical protein
MQAGTTVLFAPRGASEQSMTAKHYDSPLPTGTNPLPTRLPGMRSAAPFQTAQSSRVTRHHLGMLGLA